jgi:hypothetical protein
VAAVAALRERRVAAPVEQQDGLLGPVEARRDGVRERLGQDRAFARAVAAKSYNVFLNSS